MEIQLLRDPDIFPSEKELQEALGVHIEIYRHFMREVAEPHYGLKHEWRYYHDGKAWLCKVTHKKKTILWLSVWRSYFKTGFYFTEKNGAGIDGLPIDETIKKEFMEGQPIGKLKPLIINISKAEQLQDLLSLIRYKMSCK